MGRRCVVAADVSLQKKPNNVFAGVAIILSAFLSRTRYGHRKSDLKTIELTKVWLSHSRESSTKVPCEKYAMWIVLVIRDLRHSGDGLLRCYRGPPSMESNFQECCKLFYDFGQTDGSGHLCTAGRTREAPAIEASPATPT